MPSSQQQSRAFAPTDQGGKHPPMLLFAPLGGVGGQGWHVREQTGKDIWAV